MNITMVFNLIPLCIAPLQTIRIYQIHRISRAIDIRIDPIVLFRHRVIGVPADEF